MSWKKWFPERFRVRVSKLSTRFFDEREMTFFATDFTEQARIEKKTTNNAGRAEKTKRLR